MKVLVVGSGGREHALCWAISGSPLLTKLYCAPGNPGIAAVAECVEIGVLDIPTLVGFAQDNAIDLVVPGPEAPLVAGITDAMEAAGIACCGPTRAAAQLEGSKTFTKDIADAASIPTALVGAVRGCRMARDFRSAARGTDRREGRRAGSGQRRGGRDDRGRGSGGDRRDDGPEGFRRSWRAVVIEECLVGEEVSLFALCDGEDALLLGSAQDYKRVGRR